MSANDPRVTVTEEMVREIEEKYAARDTSAANVWLLSLGWERLRAMLDERQQLIKERDETWRAKVTNAFDSSWAELEAKARRVECAATVKTVSVTCGCTDDYITDDYRTHCRYPEALRRIAVQNDDYAVLLEQVEKAERERDEARKALRDVLIPHWPPWGAKGE